MQKIWRAAGLKPHREATYPASNDPHFAAKAKQVIALYLQPPQEAAAFCVDEKSAIQAFDCVQPLLPWRSGAPARLGFEYVRHGTCSLYSALEVATGKVIGQCRTRHRSVELCAFLSRVINGRKEKQIHIILDNLSAHKTQAVQDWPRAHPGVQLHYTPTSSSWLNQVEIWFGRISSQCIRQGVPLLPRATSCAGSILIFKTTTNTPCLLPGLTAKQGNEFVFAFFLSRHY